MLVDVDEGNDEGVCDDVLGYGKIITIKVLWDNIQLSIP
jgi:hypothetical protein